MTQKVLKVGSSVAVTIPKKSLAELGLKAGDEVVVETNKRTKSVLIKRAAKQSVRQNRIAELTLNFINRYRSDLEALAKK
ncbi:MAG: AbrB/MazE/SpoVT family DNA-binding domain-containing protein [Patescibacteria group bacterium]